MPEIRRFDFRPSLVFWALLGLGLAVAIQSAQANSIGGWSGLLAVGETSPVRPVIQGELPDLVVTDDPGHDGQATYVVGLDPWARSAHEVLPNASYRYRRILMPVVASALGTIGGEALLWLLILLNAIAFAFATVRVAKIVDLRSLPPWAVLGAALNVGLWLSLQITSPDVVAFACCLAGLAAWQAGKDVPAIVWMSLSSLAKETYVLVPVAIVIYLWVVRGNRKRGLLFATSLIPPAAWSGYLMARIPDPFESGGNLSWPFLGIFDAANSWGDNSVRELAFLVVAFAALIASGLLLVKAPRSIWAWLGAPWLLLASISSHWIWDFGNNAARAVIPLVTFAILGWTEILTAGSGGESRIGREKGLPGTHDQRSRTPSWHPSPGHSEPGPLH